MKIRPYGDTLNDGQVQLSFTLPIELSPKAIKAAELFVLKLGFKSCEIVHSESLANDFTLFLAYGQSVVGIDLNEIELDESPEHNSMSFDEINAFIKEKIGRKIVIVGACTGSDAHTVALDAIMNMKGCNHHFGLERYPMIETHNLGAQIPNEDLIDFALQINADAILVSQVVTQKDIHIKNMDNFIGVFAVTEWAKEPVIIVGGPRITNNLALELGFDAGFGKNTYAEHVATFIIKELERRSEQ